MPDIPELTDAEKLTALETYGKFIKTITDDLRVRVNEEMGRNKAERVAAYMPDGTKIGAVSRSSGRVTAKLTDPAAALRWCLDRYPGEIVQAVNPAFLKKLLDVAGSLPAGSRGLDPATGEELPFIEVQRGNPYVSVTSTKEGVEIMAALANGFTAALEGPQ